MAPPESPRPRFAALAAILLVGATVLLFVVQRTDDSFSPHNYHGGVTSHGLALASNLSTDTRLFLFNFARVDQNELVTYAPYGRFPVPAFALIKLALTCAGDDLGNRVYFARLLMIGFFAGALWFAFLLVRSWTGHAWRALGATLLAGSTFYVQFYKDMVFNEMPALFGLMFVLWAIARWRRGCGRGWLIPSVVIGVSLGWQVAAALLVWLVVELLQAWTGRRAGPGRTLRVPFGTIAIAAIVGGAWLGFNLWNEWTFTGDVSTVNRAVKRMGLAGQPLPWDQLGLLALYRGAASVVPYCLLPSVASGFSPPNGPTSGQAGLLVLLGVLVILTVIRIARTSSTDRGTAAIVAVSGLAWMLMVRRYFAPHDFAAVFFFATTVMLHDSLFAIFPKRLVPFAAIGAAALFAVSAVHVGDALTAGVAERPFTKDFQRIRQTVPRGSYMHVDRSRIPFPSTWFYLSGYRFAERAWADYTVSARRDARKRAINPDAEAVFLIPRGRRNKRAGPSRSEQR